MSRNDAVQRNEQQIAELDREIGELEQALAQAQDRLAALHLEREQLTAPAWLVAVDGTTGETLLLTHVPVRKDLEVKIGKVKLIIKLLEKDGGSVEVRKTACTKAVIKITTQGVFGNIHKTAIFAAVKDEEAADRWVKAMKRVQRTAGQ